MDEWVWSIGGMKLTGETEVLGEKHYTALVVDGWMSMERWWNDIDRGNWSAGRKTLYSVGGRWMNENGALVEWYWQGKLKYWENTSQIFILSTTNPHELTWNWTWAFAARRWRPPEPWHGWTTLMVFGSGLMLCHVIIGETLDKILTFCWPCCISVYLSQYLTNLMHKLCFTISFISCLYMFRTHVLETCRGMK